MPETQLMNKPVRTLFKLIRVWPMIVMPAIGVSKVFSILRTTEAGPGKIMPPVAREKAIQDKINADTETSGKI